MIGPGIRVPRERGEATRRALKELGLLREELEILREASALTFPVVRRPEPPIPGTEAVEVEFVARRAPRPSSYAELADVPASLRPKLPRSFDVVGDLVVVRVPPELERYAGALGEALRAFVPGTRLVAADDGVEGPSRLRRLRRLAGTGPFRTVHRENRLEFEVDLERAYFSPRLGREHRLVAEATRPGERVLDACCGVGPFGITLLARSGAREATLVDANPDAIELARANAARAGVAGRCRTAVARIEAFVATAEPFDRVIFNLPHEGIKYETQVGGAVARGGTLHAYEFMERSGRTERLADRAGSLPGGDWTLVEQHVVHPYSPTSDLVAATFRRPP
jgi:tRNA (guanine37-N1)-methyltransferase